ncbi:hypothetical protein KIN20_035927 [Parelaphostrongylus tenuis]|uniref:Uncharacterized protein n=1 Tax=Parelaphostrongylus tenuis TaxID=148309 RepID=A0AAD5RCA7_PARTN|nr:hypothetical protein KIN20_035927 [Parelaphostrongylus tenuis]
MYLKLLCIPSTTSLNVELNARLGQSVLLLLVVVVVVVDVVVVVVVVVVVDGVVVVVVVDGLVVVVVVDDDDGVVVIVLDGVDGLRLNIVMSHNPVSQTPGNGPKHGRPLIQLVPFM